MDILETSAISMGLPFCKTYEKSWRDDVEGAIVNGKLVTLTGVEKLDSRDGLLETISLKLEAVK